MGSQFFVEHKSTSTFVYYCLLTQNVWKTNIQEFFFFLKNHIL